MLSSYIFYLAILTICIFIAYVADKFNSKNILYFLMFIFIFVAGLRNEEVGLDTPNYIEYWEAISSDDIVYVELGFQWLILILQKISLHPTLLFITCSFIIYYLIIIRLWDFRKIASFPMMIAVLYAFSLMPSMNIMRQYCAIAIIFYSTRFLFNRQYLKFLIGIIIATLLHTSALSAILLYFFEFLWRPNLSKSFKILFIFVLIVFSVIGLQLYNLLNAEYGQYFEDSEESLGALTLLKIMFILISFYCSKLWSKKIVISDATIEYRYLIKLIFNIYLFGVALESLTYFFPFMGRIGLPFSIFGIVYWGILLKLTNNIFLKECYFIAFLLLYGFPFIMSMVSNGYGTMPYLFYWQ